MQTKSMLDAKSNFEQNKTVLFATHRNLFVLLLATAAMDASTTYLFMSVLGIAEESNPVVRLLSFQMGIIAGPLLGKLIQILAVWCFSVITPRLTGLVCAVVILINVYAVVVNWNAYSAAV